MYLVAAPDFQKVNVSLLRTYIHGYDQALGDSGLPTQHDAFLGWLQKRRPDLKHSALWYGEALLPKMDNDHERVVRQILEWVGEFEAFEQSQ